MEITLVYATTLPPNQTSTLFAPTSSPAQMALQHGICLQSAQSLDDNIALAHRHLLSIGVPISPFEDPGNYHGFNTDLPGELGVDATAAFWVTRNHAERTGGVFRPGSPDELLALLHHGFITQDYELYWTNLN